MGVGYSAGFEAARHGLGLGANHAATQPAGNQGHSPNSPPNTNTSTNPNTSTTLPATPNTQPPAPQLPDLSQLPARVAEQMPGGTPDNAMATVQHTIDALNQVPGTTHHYTLIARNGYQMVADHGRLLNLAQERAFNLGTEVYGTI